MPIQLRRLAALQLQQNQPRARIYTGLMAEVRVPGQPVRRMPMADNAIMVATPQRAAMHELFEVKAYITDTVYDQVLKWSDELLEPGVGEVDIIIPQGGAIVNVGNPPQVEIVTSERRYRYFSGTPGEEPSTPLIYGFPNAPRVAILPSDAAGAVGSPGGRVATRTVTEYMAYSQDQVRYLAANFGQQFRHSPGGTVPPFFEQAGS